MPWIDWESCCTDYCKPKQIAFSGQYRLYYYYYYYYVSLSPTFTCKIYVNRFLIPNSLIQWFFTYKNDHCCHKFPKRMNKVYHYYIIMKKNSTKSYIRPHPGFVYFNVLSLLWFSITCLNLRQLRSGRAGGLLLLITDAIEQTQPYLYAPSYILSNKCKFECLIV